MIKLTNGKVIKPLHNYVFVKVDDEYENPYIKKQTDSGLILPHTPFQFSQDSGEMEKAEVQIVFGIVVAIGDGVKELQIGDEVYYDKRGARVIPILEGGYRMISEQNIQSRIFTPDETV